MAIAAVFSMATGITPAGVSAAVDNSGTFLMNGKIINAAAAPPYTWNDLFNANGTQKLIPNPHTGPLLGSAFVQDYVNPDNSYFSSNGAGVKDIDALANWGCTTLNNPLSKDNLLNAYAALFLIPKTSLGYTSPTDTSPSNHVVFFAASERESNNGDSFAGFWLFQDPSVSCNPATGGFTGTHTVGDLLILSNYTNGGGTQAVNVFKWVGGTNPLTNVANGGICDNPGPSVTDIACAIANSPTGTATLQTCNNVIGTNWPTGNTAASGINSGPSGTYGLDCSTFVEVGVDITEALGVGLASAPCEEFAKFMAETRSSQQTTATLKDFAGGNMSVSNCTQPSVATVQTPTTGTVGTTSYNDSAQVTATSGSVAGETITFKAFGPYSTAPASTFCTGSSVPTPAFTTTGTLSADPSISGQYDASTSSAFSPTTAGTYYWVAYYPGDNPPGHNLATNSSCLGEPITVNPASPTIGTQLNVVSGGGALGSVIDDTATLSGTFGSPSSESVSFSLWGPYATGVTPTCTAGTNEPAFTTTGALSGSGGTWTATSGQYTINNAGTYVWTASFAGDTNNGSTSEGCNGANESITVPEAVSHTTTDDTLNGNASSIVVGTTATIGDHAVVTGFSPTGTVTFTLYANSNCTTAANPAVASSAVTLSSGTADFQTTWTPTSTGTYYWKASYSGDPNNNPSSECGGTNETITVTKATSSVPTNDTLNGNQTSITVGHSATIGDHVAVGGYNPTGTVTFTLYSDATCTTAASPAVASSAITLSSGSADYQTSWTPTSTGTYYWKVVYSGDPNNFGSSACGGTNETISVVAGSTTLPTNDSLNGNQTSITVGQAATIGDHVAVGGFNPTGTVTFTLYANSDCSTAASPAVASSAITLSGGAADYQTSWTPSSTGTYYWKVVYSGDPNNNASSACGGSNETIAVVPTDTTVPTDDSLDGNQTTLSVGLPATIGDEVVVSGFNPTGTATFSLFSDATCTTPASPAVASSAITLSGGSADYQTTWTPASTGTYYWKVVYSGDPNNNPSSGCGGDNETITVVAPSLALSKTVDDVNNTTSDAQGADVKSATVAAFTPLNFDITLSNAGPGTAAGVLLSDPLPSVPTATTTAWQIDSVTSSGAVPANLTCAITTGDVLTCGLGTALDTFDMGVGSITVEVSHPTDDTTVDPGVYANTATAQSTNDSNAPLSSSATEYVMSLTTQASAAVAVGQGISDVATVHGGNSPTGTVTFHLYAPGDTACTGTDLVAGNSAFTVALSNGQATSPSYTSTAAGTYQWIATYNGDSNNPRVTGKCGDAGEQVTTFTATVQAVTEPAKTGDWTIFTVLGAPLVLIGIVLLAVSRRRQEGEA